MQEAEDGWEFWFIWTPGERKKNNCSYYKRAETAKGTEWQTQRKLQVKRNGTTENIQTKENQ